MLKHLLSSVILFLFACNPAPSSERGNLNSKGIKNQPGGISFNKYCNPRFGYCLDYPDEILYPQPESYNRDGRTFKNKNGEEILAVWGTNNADPDFGSITLEQRFQDDLLGADSENGNKDRVITYQKLGKTFFVSSGYKKGKVFYQKTVLKDGAFAYAVLEYNEANKATFDQVSDRIFTSFKLICRVGCATKDTCFSQVLPDAELKASNYAWRLTVLSLLVL